MIASAFGANNKAYDIAKKVEKANEGFAGESSTMEMTLINGDKRVVRSMKSSTLEVNLEEGRTLLEFTLPKDVKGTKLLTTSFDNKDDNQWIYFRQRRIAAFVRLCASGHRKVYDPHTQGRCPKSL